MTRLDSRRKQLYQTQRPRNPHLKFCYSPSPALFRTTCPSGFPAPKKSKSPYYCTDSQSCQKINKSQELGHTTRDTLSWLSPRLFENQNNGKNPLSYNDASCSIFQHFLTPSSSITTTTTMLPPSTVPHDFHIMHHSERRRKKNAFCSFIIFGVIQCGINTASPCVHQPASPASLPIYSGLPRPKDLKPTANSKSRKESQFFCPSSHNQDIKVGSIRKQMNPAQKFAQPPFPPYPSIIIIAKQINTS